MELLRPLSAPEARVFGALIEKEITTPDYYPLSLNALLNACNQKNNREPVMDLDEETVRRALHGLEDLRLAGPARGADSRVAKFEHWLGEAFNFSRAETALMCVLLLRGPQTPGELRGRAERMHNFEEVGDVLGGLQKLMDRQPALVALLPRQPGSREARYTQLLTGTPDMPAMPAQPARAAEATSPEQESRIAGLEATVAELQQQVAKLTRRIDDLFGD